MVTRPNAAAGLAGALGRLALGRLALAALAGALLLGSGAPPAAAQSNALYFLSLKRGTIDATGSGENLFERLDTVAGHGPLQGERSAPTWGLEFDVYGIAEREAGLGLGIEVVQYDKTWRMQDGEEIHMRGKGVLFTIKRYWRLGSVLPFVAAGLGNYYLNYEQNPGGPTFRDSPSSAYTARAGVRWMLGRFGLLLEAGATHAALPITIDVGTADVELGGRYANGGLFWVF
jgi:hypothetical protein